MINNQVSRFELAISRRDSIKKIFGNRKRKVLGKKNQNVKNSRKNSSKMFKKWNEKDQSVSKQGPIVLFFKNDALIIGNRSLKIKKIQIYVVSQKVNYNI
jgi:hypothetical protein